MQPTFQALIESIYYERDKARGVEGTTLWFVEEVGELVRAIRRGERDNLEVSFGDRVFGSTFAFSWLHSFEPFNLNITYTEKPTTNSSTGINSAINTMAAPVRRRFFMRLSNNVLLIAVRKGLSPATESGSCEGCVLLFDAAGRAG